ncbi:transmembrane protease serine 12 isoform X2 [Octopus sinensis]|uniref:Transmembrane protease serine 12 isoform X2 n=1 Tax=Octopus sinensis TaxID=2607531 RepID=A0A6P7T146_9MOLL|nr:transmembrane protease serine 12 isoform X2 [Octopus sinensis]
MFTPFLLITILIAGNAVEVFSSHHRHIMGGIKAEQCEFPWIVSLLLIKGRGYFVCSGTLINDLQVLTAAHCAKDVDKIIVSAGSSNRRSMTTFTYVFKSGIHSHPDYVGPPSFENDIAIINLPSSISDGHCIKPLGIPEKGENISNNCIIAGWGVSSKNSYGTNQLQTAKVKAFSQSQCKQHFSRITKQQLCAGSGVRNGAESCRGDSGGPLMCHRVSDNKLVVVGVTSYGNYKCNTGFTVYSNVSYFEDWIDNINYDK